MWKIKKIFLEMKKKKFDKENLKLEYLHEWFGELYDHSHVLNNKNQIMQYHFSVKILLEKKIAIFERFIEKIKLD